MATLSVNAQTGTTYTLQASDAGKVVNLTNASAITVTANSSVFATGDVVHLRQGGAGSISIDGSATPTLPNGDEATRTTGSMVTLFWESASTYTVTGDTTAAAMLAELGVYTSAEVDAAFQPLDSDLTTIAAANNGSVLAATTASFTTADESKLDGIEANADVTDAANVETALEAITLTGVTPATGDEFLIIDATDGGLKAVNYDDLPGAGGGLANIVEDTTPQLGGALDVNGQEITGAIDLHSTGDVIAELGDAAGTNKLSVRDSGGVEVAAVDSDGNITTSGTVDGRDVAADGSKLDGIESGADVTDTANVTAAGALMDSEVDADIKTLSLPANTTISTFGASLVDDADAATARATLDVDQAGTDNSTDVTLAGSLDYITLSGQQITRNAIDLTTDVTGDLPVADGGTGSSTAAGALTNLGALPVAGGTMTGALVLEEVRETHTTVAASGATETIDVTNGTSWDVTMDQNCTFTFSGATSGKLCSFTLILRGSFTPTWPASVDWDSASAPTYATPAVFEFWTVDGGATWFGAMTGSGFG